MNRETQEEADRREKQENDKKLKLEGVMQKPALNSARGPTSNQKLLDELHIQKRALQNGADMENPLLPSSGTKIIQNENDENQKTKI